MNINENSRSHTKLSQDDGKLLLLLLSTKKLLQILLH